MPNYSLQINSRFRPFSFQEMLAPWQLYGQAYKEQEEMLADLDTKANIWENMINREQDPELYQQYSDYANALRVQAESIASQGLDTTSRQAILGLRSRYAKDIVPIENAFNTRKEQAKMQLQARMQNPSLMFSRDAANTKLLDYINNPELDYDTINGNDVTQKVFAQAQALSKELINDKESLRKVLGGDYYEYAKQRGFTKEAVLAAILNSPEANPTLTQMVEQAVDSTPVKNWGDENMVERVRNYARQGLWGAVGTQETQLVNNWRAQATLSHSNAMDEAKERDKYKYMFPFKSSDGNTYYYNAALGMYMQEDEDGNMNLVEKPKDAPQKLGATPNPANNKSENSEGKVTRIKSEDLTDNGYQLAGVTLLTRDGNTWETYGDDEKLTRDSRRDSFYVYNRSIWHRNKSDFTPNTEDNRGKMTKQNKPRLIDMSEEDLINTFYVGDSEKLTDIGNSINDYIMFSLGIPEGIYSDDIKIVKATTPNVTSTGKFDYLIFRKD